VADEPELEPAPIVLEELLGVVAELLLGLLLVEPVPALELGVPLPPLEVPVPLAPLAPLAPLPDVPEPEDWAAA
jgi:hypothetical protein